MPIGEIIEKGQNKTIMNQEFLRIQKELTFLRLQKK